MIMIKSNKGRVELEGTPIVLVGELGTAIQAVYQALLNAGKKILGKHVSWHF